MRDKENPGKTKPQTTKRVGGSQGGGGKKPKVDLENETLDEAIRREAIENAHKSVTDLKITYDKLNRDVSAVASIEATLRQKKYDAGTQIKFLHTETTKVKVVIEALLTAWTTAKIDVGNICTKPLQKIDVWTKANDAKKESTLKQWKDFAREVLSEFKWTW